MYIYTNITFQKRTAIKLMKKRKSNTDSWSNLFSLTGRTFEGLHFENTALKLR